MAATDTSDQPDGAKTRSKLPLLLGLLLATVLGAAGFFLAYNRMLPAVGLGSETVADSPGDEAEPAAGGAVSFVPIDPMVISLGTPGRGRHLKFSAELEVVPGQEQRVQALMPRILDVLNGYVRAVPLAELERASALVTLRAQMLRRIQLVVGQGLVRDLLVTEFVLN
jgi:flagellar FliL protein